MYRIIQIVILCLWMASSLGCARRAGLPDKPIVTVSIAPQAYIVERIAGNTVHVETLLPAGVPAEAFDPTPSQLQTLARTSIYVRIYVPFETANWTKIHAVQPEMTVVNGRDGMRLRTMEAHGDDHQDDGKGNNADPHVWLSIDNAKTLAQHVADVLTAAYPDNSELYASNLASLMNDFASLSSDLRSLFGDNAGGTFWVFHPAWGYLADDFGITQRAIEVHGKAPGARALVALENELKNSGVHTIFIDPNHDTAQPEIIARDINAKTAPLDPLEKDLIANLRRTASAIHEALQ